MVDKEKDLLEQIGQTPHCDFECCNTNIRTCVKCHKCFCPRHASKVQPQFCQDCMKDVALVIDKFTKVEEDFDFYSNEVVRHRSSCTRLQMNGPDYVFYNQAIRLLTDDELKTQYEFMNFMRGLIEAEQTSRRIRKLDELRNSPIPANIMSVKTTTTVRKSREVKPLNLFQQFLKMGIDKPTAKQMAVTGGQNVTDDEYNKA